MIDGHDRDVIGPDPIIHTVWMSPDQNSSDIVIYGGMHLWVILDSIQCLANRAEEVFAASFVLRLIPAVGFIYLRSNTGWKRNARLIEGVSRTSRFRPNSARHRASASSSTIRRSSSAF